jgi:hypothetical protein
VVVVVVPVECFFLWVEGTVVVVEVVVVTAT